MKKFGKFIFATLSVAAFAGGAYYFIKNIVNKDTVDEFDDFEDDFEDFDLDADVNTAAENRGYVTLNTGDFAATEDEENSLEETKAEESVSEDDVPESDSQE